MAKHTYTFTINRLPAEQDPIEYKFRNTMCILTACPDGASVSFSMGVKKTFEDLVSFRVDLVKDAMRKMYLLHIMKFSAALLPRVITVTIDGESMVYDHSCPGFPFLRSMLTAGALELPDAWTDPVFLRTVLVPPKSRTDRDSRYACLFSFLSGTGKRYESERFTCFWTAMNAHYEHLMDRYRQECVRRHGLTRYEDLPKKKQLSSGDNGCIGALMRVLGCGSSLSSRNDRISFRTQYGAIKNLLCRIPREELRVLCRELWDHRTDFSWVPDGPLGTHLRACMDRTGSTAWGFLALDYAYYMRCGYLHGSKAAVLFSAPGDPEVAAFRTLNLLLEAYLKEAIPQMFREDWLTEAMYLAIDLAAGK